MAADLHLEILPKRQRDLFDKFASLEWVRNFYLAGGTALALQIAHRRSIDFDFFTENSIDLQKIKRRLALIGDYQVSAESDDLILDGRLNSVRVSFFNLPFPLIDQEITVGKLRIIAKKDIAAMKLLAISSRGSRKDFVDLYFLLREYSLEQMIGFFTKKYGESRENIYCALKGLLYFVDAEKKPMPTLLRIVPWREIKKTIIAAHKAYLQKIKEG